MMSKDELYMRQAIELAKSAWGQTHPNPMVGALFVEDGEVLASGFHHRAGDSHAEIEALANLKSPVNPAMTLYVTLEPCSTQGCTGACTDAILNAGIKRVVVGTLDPNPAHAGRGIEILRQSGIEVITGVLADACCDLNLIFNHWIVNQRPLVAAKMATTIDGKVATRTGHSKWITGEETRNEAMLWRRLFPAMAVGSGTVCADNPTLTARIPGQDVWCPIRFVFDRGVRTLQTILPNLYTDLFAERTILVTTTVCASTGLGELEKKGVSIWHIEAQSSEAFIKAFLQRCTGEEIYGILIEGGASLLNEFFNAGCIDYLYAYRAPKILADAEAMPCLFGRSVDRMDGAIALTEVKHQCFANGDQLMRGYVTQCL